LGRAFPNLIERGGARLSSLTSTFLGNRLLDQDPEIQRRLRATVVALGLSSIVGTLFVMVWTYLGDPRAGLLMANLIVMWIAMLSLRRTLRLDLFAYILGFQILAYWVLNAVLLDHLGASTYAGMYLAPVAAFLFGGLRIGRAFGGLTLVGITLLWFCGRTGVLDLQHPAPATLALDRVGLLVLMAAFAIVVVYEQMFLDRVLVQTGEALDVRAHRLALLPAEGFDNASAQLGETLTSVSHDLNNPLTYALANMSVLKEGADEDRMEMLRDAYEGLQRMADIVSDLGSRSTDLSEVSIDDVIETTLRSMRSEIDARATLVVDLQASDDIVLGHRSRLVQVLVNLLTNSVQAIPTGSPNEQTIAIRSRSKGNQVEVVVSDTGHGIPAVIRDRVLEPFFTTKGAGEGTGLGLAICARIALEHGGSLRLGTQMRGHTEMILSLPRWRLRARRHETLATPVLQTTARADLHVLVIDDDPGMRKLVQSALKPMHVVVLEDGRQAAALCMARDFDVVVCDIMMPNMGGEEVYDAVVAEAPRYANRFLFMTGGVFSSGGSEFLAGREERVLLKPMSMDALRSHIVAQALASRSRGPT